MKLVIFDLDNTLINGQSQQYLLSYAYREKLIGFYPTACIMIWFAAYRLSLIRDIEPALRFAFNRLLKGKRVTDLRKMIESFYSDVLEKKLNLQAVNRLKGHLAQGDRVIILSNTIKPLVDYVAEKLHVAESLATSPEEINGVYNGRISGKIIYGKNKLELARPLLETAAESSSVAYADHRSDLPLLCAVDEPVAVNPDRILESYAVAHNWEIIKAR